MKSIFTKLFAGFLIILLAFAIITSALSYSSIKKYNIEMPIVNAVYDVLYNGLEPRKAVTMLMTRAKKSE